MVSVKIDVKKKDLVWLVPLVAVLIVGVVYAYNSGANPSVMGHSAEELEIAWGDISDRPDGLDDGDDVDGGYCYTYYNTASLTSCVCPAGEVNKKDLGLWGWCTDYYYAATIFRPAGFSCAEVNPSTFNNYYYKNTDVGLACVCCG